MSGNGAAILRGWKTRKHRQGEREARHCQGDSHFFWIGNMYCECGERHYPKSDAAFKAGPSRARTAPYYDAMIAIARSLNNTVHNGCGDELAKMSDEAVAYDLAQHDADCERLAIAVLIEGVRYWRGPSQIA